MKHGLRGAVTAWLALIALQTISTRGSGKVAGAFTAIDGLVKRALDPSVPAIPDRRTGAGTSSSASGYITPANAAAAARASAASNAVTAVTGPGGALSGLPSLSQYANGGGLPAGILNNPALHPAG